MSKKKGEVSRFSAAGKEKKKRSLSSIILIAVIIFALVYFVMSAVRIVNLNNERDDALEHKQELQEKKEDLQAEYKNISSPEYMERLARRDLKLIKGNELLFILPDLTDKEDEEAGDEEQQQ